MENRKLNQTYGRRQLIVFYGLWLAMSLIVLRRAWVGEDAYITFRVIDNFLHGYGLRWNIYERVQVYTHPLWMLLHLPFAAVVDNIFWVNIFLSVCCTSGALFLSLYTAKKPLPIVIGCFLLPLLLSKSFMDFSTSGMENPLGYLLLALFGHVLLTKRDHRYFWLYATLSVALALLNRLDMIVLYAPVIAYVFMRTKPIRWGQIIIGMLPLLAWFAFALIYYGFIFPNTKYAKLNTGLSEWLYLSEGLQYAKFLLLIDMAGAILIFSSLIFFVRPRLFSLTPSHDALPCAFAAGIFCYCLYIVAIGGDYMIGRFWSIPVFASAWLWLMACPARIRPDKLFLAGCLLVSAHFASMALNDIHHDCDPCITLQKKIINSTVTFANNRLITTLDPFTLQSEGHYMLGKKGKKLAATEHAPVTTLSYVGMEGYYAGPDTKIIDELGLADPLLARLPASQSQEQNFYIGHFKRKVPQGYAHFIETGSYDQMNPALARYDQKLHIITSAPLWDAGRLKTIVEFNLGYYDHWKEDYLHHAF